MPALDKRATHAGRPAGKFTQYRRLDRLREALEGHPNGLSLERLGRMLHVTTRSVRRYLSEVDRQVEVESIETKPGGAHLWRIKPSERGRAIPLRRTQAYGMLASRRIFDILKGSALYDELDVVARELLPIAQRLTRAGVKGDVPGNNELEKRFLYLPAPPRNYPNRGDELDDLFHAVANLHAIHFRYRHEASLGAKATALAVHPYALLLHHGDLFCLGYDLNEEEVRPFSFFRMSEIRVRPKELFKLPAGFDIAPFLHGEFGVGPEGPRHRVLVEFDRRIADEVRSRKVHPSQKIATAADGRIRLSMDVTDLDKVARWVLGFGMLARVIEPDTLVTKIRTDLQVALKRYEP